MGIPTRGGTVSDAVTELLDRGTVRDVVQRPPRSHLRAAIAIVLLLACLGVVLLATTSPTPLDQGYESSIDKFLAVLHRNGVPDWFDYRELEFTANVAMFVPLGLLLGLALGRVMWLGILLLPALSAGIEWFQATFLSARIATLQDVVANSIGGWIGLLCAAIIVGMVHARDRKVINRALWDARYGPRR